jgi:O-antigen/teichoic acid export membrane protein
MFGRRFLWFVTPVLLQTLVSIAILPITTKILGPEDYAVFALVLAMTGLCATLSQLGVGFILAKDFRWATPPRQRVVMTTLATLTMLISCGLFVVLWGVWSAVAAYWETLSRVPSTAIWLAGGEMIASAIWGVIAAMCVQTGAARQYASVTLSKMLVSTIVLMVALFQLHLGFMALFAGHFAGGLVGLIGASILMRRYFVPVFDLGLAGQALRLGFSLSAANVMENVQRVYERTLLSTTAGLTMLGLYSHAQQYESMTVTVIRPASQAALPVMLDEARAQEPLFQRTRRVWRAIYLAVTLAALIFAFVGTDVINLLTNNKFGEAAPIAALLVAVNLVRFACRPNLGLLMTAGRGQVVALSTAAGAVLAMICLAVLVPMFGMWGAVAATYVHYLTFQAIVVNVANRQRVVAPLTGWEVIGVGLVLLAVALVQIYQPPLQTRAWIALTVVLAFGACGRRIIGDIHLQLRESLRPTS